MPSFEIDCSHTITYDFEVFCGTCGAGICDHVDTRTSRLRGHPQITVEVCKDCKNQWQEKLDELNQTNDSLQDKINSLVDEVEHWKKIAEENK
jgi:hypothetical protein